MSAPSIRPFVPTGRWESKGDAQAEARKRTRERDPEIWKVVPVRGGFAVQRVS
jgi:hypothetical protein